MNLVGGPRYEVNVRANPSPGGAQVSSIKVRRAPGIVTSCDELCSALRDDVHSASADKAVPPSIVWADDEQIMARNCISTPKRIASIACCRPTGVSPADGLAVVKKGSFSIVQAGDHQLKPALFSHPSCMRNVIRIKCCRPRS